MVRVHPAQPYSGNTLDRMRINPHPIALFRGFCVPNFSSETKDRLWPILGTGMIRTFCFQKNPSALFDFAFQKGRCFYIPPKIHNRKEAPVRWFWIPADRCFFHFQNSKRAPEFRKEFRRPFCV